MEADVHVFRYRYPFYVLQKMIRQALDSANYREPCGVHPLLQSVQYEYAQSDAGYLV